MAIDSAPDVLGWLKAQPLASTIEWGDDGLSAEHPYATRAADPVVADCPVMWPWHVIGPDEPEQNAFGSPPIALEYDIEVFEVWPTGPCIGPLGTWIAARDRPLDAVSAYKLAELRALPGAMLVLSGGWLPRTISSALESWSLKCADRGDLRFRWSPRQRSTLLATFGHFIQAFKSPGPRSSNWVVLHPAPELQAVSSAVSPQERDIRRPLRVAQARRWRRRMRVDPALAWLTPLEVRMLLDLNPELDVFAWAANHHVQTRESCGIEPVLEAAAVLALASL